MNSRNPRSSFVRIGVLVVLGVITLGGCGGGGSGGGGVPVAALGVAFEGGSSHPEGVINDAVKAQVDVEVTLPSGSMDSDTVTVILSDSQATTAQGAGNGITGGGEVHVMIDASALADGPIDVTVQAISSDGTSESTFPGAFMKDTTAPELPISLAPLDAQGAASQWVNLATVSAVTVAATFQNPGNGQDSAQLVVNPGNSPIMPAAQTFASTSLAFQGLDLSSVPDGPFELKLTVTDENMNSATMTVSATKDTIAPGGAVASQVWPGPSNPADTINLASVSAVSVLMGFGVDAEARNAVATLSDTATTVTTQTASVPNGGGFQWVDGTDATTLADGPVTLVVTVSDAAGNTTSFTGTPATKDTVAPAAATSADVAAGGANPASVINLVSSGAVGVTVVWPSASSSGDSATVTLTSGSSVTSAAFNPPAGGGASSVTGLNATPLADGAVAVSVTVTDAAGNAATTPGVPALKDTIPPSAPTIARVAAGPGNNQDVINIASVGSVSGIATFPAPAQANETFVLSFDDSSTTIGGVPATVPAGGGPVTVGPMNLGALSDGFVSVSVTVTDAAQNTTSMSGTVATKDTVPPTGPTAASVTDGHSNAAGVINSNTVGAVAVTVTWPAGAPGADTAQVILNAGATVTAPVAQAAGGGVTAATGIDATALAEGPVSVAVMTTDSAGNMVSFTGTAASKDTVPPAAASAVTVPAGPSNPANWVNAATVSACTIQASLPAGASASDTISVACTDASTTVTRGEQPCPAGGGTVNFTLNLAPLNDGNLTLVATVTDAAGNTATTFGTSASKDVVAPADPLAARVPQGPANPADMINMATVTASSVSVSWPGDGGNESMYVVVSDGVSSQASLPQSLGAAASHVGFAGLNCTPLADGSIEVTVTVTDPAGNATTYVGTPATKDTQPPSGPASAHVSASTGNPIDFINAATSGSVSCDVVFGAGNPADVATVTLSDGTSGASSPAMAVNPGRPVSYTGINAGLLADGPVSVSVNVIDVAGNLTTYSGTAATKDTIAPVPATAVSIPAGPGNSAGYVTLANAYGVTAAATMPAQGPGTTATCTLSDGFGSVSSPVMPVPAAGGPLAFGAMKGALLGDGPLTVTVTVKDAAGNPSATVAAASKDTIAPVVTVDPTTSPTAATVQTVTGETEAGSSLSIAGGAVVANGTTNAWGRFAVPVRLNPGSANDLAIAATDAAGNASSGARHDFAMRPLSIVQNLAAPPVVFTDVSAASGLADVGSAGGGAFQDLDNDGDLDVFVGGTNKLWQNDGLGSFTDVTAASSAMNGGTSAAFADYDADGDLDVLLVDGANATLMRNEWVPLGVLKFVDATAAIGGGVSGSLTSGLWLDLGGDGWIDCVVADSTAGLMDLVNNADGTFTSQSLFGTPASPMFFGLAADLVADGRCDLVVGGTTGAFLRNDGGSAFTDITGPTSGIVIKQSIAGGMIAADCDNDGDLDLVVSGGDGSGGNQIHLNAGTRWFSGAPGGSPIAQLAGVSAPDRWVDLAAGDVDNDGRIDLWVGRNGANRLFLNVGDTNADGVWEYVEVAGPCGIGGVGDTRLVQLADVDGDGDLDLFAGNQAGADEVWRNEVNNHRNLTVTVAGLGGGSGTSSKDAIGAHVELRDAAGTTVLASREISGGRGYGSQDALRAHFGVTPSEIYTVRVTFPSGEVRTVTNVVPRDLGGQRLTVSE
jgi:ASPIC and UnbV/FG-GAP-like repeat/Bacterial Ig domain